MDCLRILPLDSVPPSERALRLIGRVEDLLARAEQEYMVFGGDYPTLHHEASANFRHLIRTYLAPLRAALCGRALVSQPTKDKEWVAGSWDAALRSLIRELDILIRVWRDNEPVEGLSWQVDELLWDNDIVDVLHEWPEEGRD